MTVVRVADEIVVDLMRADCGIAEAEASTMVMEVEIHGVAIPFGIPLLPLKTKQTARDKDELERAALAQLLASRGEAID